MPSEYRETTPDDIVEAYCEECGKPLTNSAFYCSTNCFKASLL